jgi:hypothetical protein
VEEIEIARLAGHASPRTTEVIYWRGLRPVITTGAEVMDQIFPVEAAARKRGNGRGLVRLRLAPSDSTGMADPLSGCNAQELLQVLAGDQPPSADLHVAQVPAPHLDMCVTSAVSLWCRQVGCERALDAARRARARVTDLAIWRSCGGAP